jgi:hypothetical protein
LTAAGRYTLRVLKFNESPLLRDFWMKLEHFERDASEELQEANQNIRDVKAIMRRGEDSVDIHQVFDRALTRRKKILDRLAEIRSRRPFPIE